MMGPEVQQIKEFRQCRNLEATEANTPKSIYHDTNIIRYFHLTYQSGMFLVENKVKKIKHT